MSESIVVANKLPTPCKWEPLTGFYQPIYLQFWVSPQDKVLLEKCVRKITKAYIYLGSWFKETERIGYNESDFLPSLT